MQVENPYQVLGVSGLHEIPNKAVLDKLYKRLALKTHPDRGGSLPLFQWVTEAYRQVYRDLQARDQPDHQQRRARAPSASPVASGGVGVGVGGSGGGGSGGGGGGDIRKNPEKFNQFFEKNRQGTVYDDGYGTWMAKSSAAREDFSLEAIPESQFGQTFEQNRPRRAAGSSKGKLMKYQEPQALDSSHRRALTYTTLGQDTVEDFSDQGKNIVFTDYRKAHDTGYLVTEEDMRAVEKRRTFRTKEEYEAYRQKKLERPMTEKERRIYEKRIQQEEKRELQRRAKYEEEKQVAALLEAKRKQEVGF